MDRDLRDPEETGWRGYLQDEFRERPALLKYAIVGLFWYVWHLSWLGGHSIGSEATNLAFLLTASIGIGFVADRTRSIFAAAAFHVLGNIMITTSDFTTLIPSEHTRWMIVLICVAHHPADQLRARRSRDDRRDGGVHA